MITEAHIEAMTKGSFGRVIKSAIGLSARRTPNRYLPESMTIPVAIDEARALVRYLRQRADVRGKHITPIRVVDSSGAVVAQWGKP